LPKPGGHPSKIRSLVPLRNKTSRLLITSAAIAGLYAGSLASNAFAAAEKAGTAEKSAADKGKHDCKGKNACKGTGGCGAGDNGCKGKNSCKGKGGCKTATKSDKKAEAKKS
jgi:hypothetical protein